MTPNRPDLDRLMRMAMAEFAELGFDGMSMRVFADKCQVSTTALYYHFSSKEELYAEVCRHKFDEITHIMKQRIGAARLPEEKLEAVVSTLFDEWHRDNTLLLLTQRDVINVRVSPERCTAGPHYQQLMGIVHQTLSTYFGRDRGEDFSFTFGSLLFGYCSLMSFDQRASTMSAADYQQHRRDVLLQHCRRIWRSMAASD